MSTNKQQWASTVQYFTKLYSDYISFQNREAGEKPYESAACIQTTTLPASRSSFSPTNSFLSGTDREATFIAYVEALEDQVNALKYDVTFKTCLTIGSDMRSLKEVQPPAEIISSMGTSDASTAIISKLRSDDDAETLSMANLTALLT